MEKEEERSMEAGNFSYASEGTTKEGEENQFTCIWSRKG